MKKSKKLVALGLCAAFAFGTLSGHQSILFPVTQVHAEPAQNVEVKDLVIKFLGVPEYEPNRYTKKDGGKWAPEELEKGLKILASMKLGEGNPEGMMAPLKHSLADITAFETDDVAAGTIKIEYNGLILEMQQGKNTATLNDGTTTKTLTMNDAVTPYFLAIDGEENPDGSQYYACYLPVKFTAEALGGSVVWNEQMSRMEMAFAFYYSDAAITPVINSSSNYTTKKIETDSNGYSAILGRLNVKTGQDATAVSKNTADLIKAALNVVDSKYQNEDGGWGKTNTDYDLLNDSFSTLCNHAYSTFDNGSTHGHMKFLARILRIAKAEPSKFTGYETQLATIEKGFWKGVKYITNAQNTMGGWPQYYPYGVGYFKNITFNDNAMPDVMDLVFALTNDSGLTYSTNCEDFAWARTEIAAQTNADILALNVTNTSLQNCWNKALEFTLNAQVKINGVLTGWSQQYDNKTGLPTGGRAFELASISPAESLTVVSVLTNIKNPTPEIRTAIKGYVDWINSVGFTGYSYYTINDRTRELAKDKLLVKDGSTTKLFGRFYGLDTTGAYYGLNIADKLTSSLYYEIFSGRDGIAKFSMNDGMSERRGNYSFASGGADTKANGVYSSWKAALGE